MIVSAVDSEHFRIDWCAIISLYDMVPETLEITGIMGVILGWFKTIAFKPVEIHTSGYLHDSISFVKVCSLLVFLRILG